MLLETPGEVRGRDVVKKNAEEMNGRLHQVTTRITNHSIVVTGERERERERMSRMGMIVHDVIQHNMHACVQPDHIFMR